MKQIYFSENERIIFRAIAKGRSLDEIKDISNEIKFASVKYLTAQKLIKSVTNYGKIIDIKIKPLGVAYLEQYPNLENPIDEQLKELQLNELKYKERIRKQEDVIRYWKLITIVTGLLGGIGWLLLVFVRFFN